MTWLTMGVALLLLVSAAGGWRSGLVRRVVELAGLVAAVLAAGRWGGSVGALIGSATDLPDRVAAPIGWVAVMIVGIVVARILAWGASRVVRLTMLGWLDRVGGGVLGLATGAIIASVLLTAAAHLPDDGEMKTRIEDEALPRLVSKAAPALWSLAVGDDDDLERLWDDTRESAGDAARDLGEKVSETASEAASDARDAAEDAARDALRRQGS